MVIGTVILVLPSDLSQSKTYRFQDIIASLAIGADNIIDK